MDWFRRRRTFSNSKNEEHESKYGACHLLYLIDKEDNKRKLWAPSRLISYIKDNRGEKDNVFFCSLGVQPADKKRQEYTKNLFEAVFVETAQIVQLFVKNGEGEVSPEKKV